MVIHIALFSWKPTIPQADIDKWIAAVNALQGQIPEIIEIHAGVNFSKWSKGYTHAVVVKVKDKADLDIYRQHPLHQPIAKQADAMEQDSIGIDFEI